MAAQLHLMGQQQSRSAEDYLMASRLIMVKWMMDDTRRVAALLESYAAEERPPAFRLPLAAIRQPGTPPCSAIMC